MPRRQSPSWGRRRPNRPLRMVIVTAADDKFALPLGVTLYSALANLADTKSASLYIIDGGISE